MKNYLYGIGFLWFLSCQSPDPSIPAIYLAQNQAGISQKGGFLWYKDEKFSGYLYALDEQKDTILLVPFLNGKEEGIARAWYHKNQLKEERHYQAGWKTGTHHGWWEDGTQKFTYHFENDVQEGELLEWFRNGKPYKVFHYKAGHEEGAQTLYKEDGGIQANYVIREGVRYGLLGKKNCTSEWKK